MQRFNWDDLRFLLAISRGGSVSAAARSLSVDHATVIRRLEGLERALNAKLFQRNLRGYSLTVTGERLLISAKTMEEEATRASAEMGQGRTTISGGLRISALEGIGNFFLAERLAAFGTAHPDLSIDLITLQQLVALSRREADIAITLQPPVTGRFHISRLTDYDLYVYGSSEYLSRCAPIVTQADYGDHPFAGYIDDLVFVRDLNYLDKIGARVRPKLQSSSIHAQLEFVRQGYGLCILPSFVAASAPDLVRIRPDLFSLRRSYWIVANLEIMKTARGNLLVKFLESEVNDAQEEFIGQSVYIQDIASGVPR
ncbi:LysR family transcriptional regulator [Sphingomonas aerolata]|uniref:LysR family transcriptional regulator n=1 Tax=Sphingomonas aerolata TaxID=185951 RepID=UPI002FDFC5E9